MDYDDSPTPAGAFYAFWRWSPVALVISGVCLAALAGLIIAGWQLNWWWQQQNATHQYQITQNGVSNQDTNRSQITSDFTTLNTEIVQVQKDPSLKTAVLAQEDSTATDICSRAAVVTGVPLTGQQAQWVSVNCVNGTLSTSSQYYDSNGL